MSSGADPKRTMSSGAEELLAPADSTSSIGVDHDGGIDLDDVRHASKSMSTLDHADVKDPIQRHASSASGASSSQDNFAFWYPTWDTWKFRRTLAYWISILSLEGSVLFTIGAGCSVALGFSWIRFGDGGAPTDRSLSADLEMSLVTLPYFVGGLAFTIGNYCGILEVLNIETQSQPDDQHHQLCCNKVKFFSCKLFHDSCQILLRIRLLPISPPPHPSHSPTSPPTPLLFLPPLSPPRPP